MKLKFKEDTLKRYSSLDLEYGLSLLKVELFDHKIQIEILKNNGHNKYSIDREEQLIGKPIRDKIKLVEDELITRMLISD